MLLKLSEDRNQCQTIPFALSTSRLFAVIVNLSQQSPSVEPVLTSFLSLLDDLLLLKNLKVDIDSIDLTLVGWLLLLLAHVLDACIVQCKPSATAAGKENNFLFVGLPVANSNVVLSSVYVEKRQNGGRMTEREWVPKTAIFFSTFR